MLIWRIIGYRIVAVIGIKRYNMEGEKGCIVISKFCGRQQVYLIIYFLININL